MSEEKQLSCFEKASRKYAIPVFLVTGTCTVVFNKLLYGIRAPGINGSAPHNFEKPWFTNWSMFLGMTLCLVGFEVSRCIRKAMGKETEKTPRKLYWAIAVPALCDMIASFTMGVGLLWISGSVWQMLRGSIIIFTAFFKVTYRKKRLHFFEYIGILIVIVGIVIVGASTIMQPEEMFDSSDGSSDSWASFSSSNKPKGPGVGKIILGIGLVIFAQLLQAFQTIVEEKLLHDVDAPATLVVGMEGLYGLLLCSFVSMPIAYFLPGKEGNGLHENTLDSFVMIWKNKTLLIFIALYVFFILIYNVYGMIITQVTDAMVRNLMEPVRTLCVWVTNVFIFYCIAHRKMGEPLTLWSILQGAGFVLLTIGVLIYNRVIRTKCLGNDKVLDDDEEEGKENAEKKTPSNEKEPLLSVNHNPQD